MLHNLNTMFRFRPFLGSRFLTSDERDRTPDFCEVRERILVYTILDYLDTLPIPVRE